MKRNITRPDIPISTDNHLYCVNEDLVKFGQMYTNTPRELIEQGKREGKSITKIITEYNQSLLAEELGS